MIRSFLIRSFWLVVVLSFVATCGGREQPKQQRHGDPLATADAAALYAEGRGYAAVGDLVRSEQYLVAALNKGHSSHEVLPLLVEVCVRGNRYDTALFHTKPFLERDPANWRLRYLMATLHSAVGREDRAIEHLEQVLVDAPTEPDAHYTLGRLLWARNDKPRAVLLLQQYLELAPDGGHVASASSLLRLWKANQPAEILNVDPIAEQSE